MVIRVFVLLWVWILAANTKVNAQDKVNLLDVNLCISQPRGNFLRNVGQPVFGFELAYSRQLKTDKPLFWGIGLYYQSLDEAHTTISELLNQTFVDFDYNTHSQMFGFDGRLRMYPDIYIGKIEFYIEAILGYKFLFTTTTKTLVNDNEDSDTHLDKGRFSLTYGAAIGLCFPVSNHTYINLQGNYLPGLSVEYYAENEKNVINTTSLDRFDLKKSTTDMIRWDFGIIYRFGNIFDAGDEE